MMTNRPFIDQVPLRRAMSGYASRKNNLLVQVMKTARRKKPGKMEARLSMVVLALIIIAGTGVVMRSFAINPGVVALRPESHRQSLAPASDQRMLIDTTETGMAPLSPPERFSPDTLYEKINGRADLYLSSGFAALNTQRFSMDNTADKWVEVFIYDMTTPENAFSVFSMQRREGAQASDIVPNAYLTDNALFMVHNHFYLEIIGTDISEALQQAIGRLAQAFVKAHGGSAGASVPGANLFPASDLQADSLQLVAANAFGYEQLNRIHTAEYLIDGTRLTAFVSDRQTAEAASSLAVEYQQTLLAYGAARVNDPLMIAGASVMQFFDTYEIVFSRGRYLAGVHEADSLEAAVRLAGQLAAHLENNLLKP